MNSTIFSSLRFEANLKKLRKAPKDSQQSMDIFTKLLFTVESLLENQEDSGVKIFLGSHYTCPIHYRRYPESNLQYLASTIAEAFREPRVQKSFRVAHPPEDQVQDKLLDICCKRFSPYVTAIFRDIAGQCSFEFKAA